MAKAKNKPADDATQDASAPNTIKVQGIIFPVSPRYSEGHVLTAREADTLNQTFYENLRNNFAARIRKAQEAIENEAKEAGVEPRAFTGEELTQFQADFAAYAAEYTFSAPRQGRGPVDPLEREMRAVAKELIVAALQKKNISVRSLAEGQMDEYIKAAIEKRPDIREEAQKRLATRNAVADDILGLG